MKAFGQKLKTFQKHSKNYPETQKKILFKLSLFLTFFYKNLNFGPQFLNVTSHGCGTILIPLTEIEDVVSK